MTAKELGAAMQAVKSARGAFWLSEKLTVLGPKGSLVAGRSLDVASFDAVIPIQC